MITSCSKNRLNAKLEDSDRWPTNQQVTSRWVYTQSGVPLLQSVYLLPCRAWCRSAAYSNSVCRSLILSPHTGAVMQTEGVCWVMSLGLGRVLTDCRLKQRRFTNSTAEPKNSAQPPKSQMPSGHAQQIPRGHEETSEVWTRPSPSGGPLVFRGFFGFFFFFTHTHKNVA